MSEPARAPVVLTVLMSVVVGSVTAVVRPAGAQGPPGPYRPPVEAQVLDGFRLPAGPYSAGNRGIEYDTEPGQPVHAAAGGEVSFVGPVAGTLHVTVLHPDGVRTSYSFLDEVAVHLGERVQAGQVVGRAGEVLHLGARRGSAYFDPASLFETSRPRVRLVPFDDPVGEGGSGERSALSQLIGGASRVVRGTGRVLAAGGAATLDRAAGGVREVLRPDGPVAHVLVNGLPGSSAVRVLRAMEVVHGAWGRSHRECTSSSSSPPPVWPGTRVAVLVGGLGSSSQSAAIDDLGTDRLGYSSGDVARFSYAGGRVPERSGSSSGGTAGSLKDITARPYRAADTQGDLRVAGRRLADLVEEVARRRPGVPVDVLAHSQGGLVARLALVELERRHGLGWLDRIGVLATLGTPHRGADLATALAATRSNRLGRVVTDVAGDAAPLGLDPGSEAVSQLAETSPLIDLLDRHPIPPGVDAISIGARGDLVVPSPRVDLAGAPEVLVGLAGPTAHDRLPGSTEARREVALALAGEPPSCESFGEALLDGAAGEVIGAAEDALGSLAWGLTSRP